MKLTELLPAIEEKFDLKILESLEISNITSDSRKVSPSGLFFAIQGEKFDGVNSIDLWVNKSSNEYDTFSIESDISKDIRSEISKTIIHNDWDLLRLESIGMSLEDIFLRITTTE